MTGKLEETTEKLDVVVSSPDDEEREQFVKPKSSKKKKKKKRNVESTDPTQKSSRRIDVSGKTEEMTEKLDAVVSSSSYDVEREQFVKDNENVVQQETDGDTTIERKHSNDTYSFFITQRLGCSPSSWLALSVWLVQVTFFSLVTYDNLRVAQESTNPLNLPVNVSIQVKVTQAVAILITIFLQDDLRKAVECWHESYIDLQNGQNFPDSTALKWHLSLVLRFLTSLLGLAAILLLILQSDNVFDLALNFTGLGFISELDDVAFLLAGDGFFGMSIKKSAEQVKTRSYLVKEKKSWCLRVFVWLLIASGLYACYAYVTINQEYGKYACPSYYVTFNDPVIPSMQTFTGMYVEAPESRYRRPFYYTAITDGDGRSKNAMFAHNGDEWVFGLCDEPNVDDCETYVEKFLGYATTTSTVGQRSFEIRDTASDPWQLGQWIAADNKWGWELQYNPADLRQEINFQCSENINAEGISPSRLKCQEMCEKTCSEIAINEESSSFPDDEQQPQQQKRKRARVYEILNGGKATTTAYDNPIFFGRHPNSTDRTIDLILVAGNRWVLTDTSQLYGLSDALDQGASEQLMNINSTFFAGEITPVEIDALVRYFDNEADYDNEEDYYPLDDDGLVRPRISQGFHALQLSNRNSIAYLSDEIETSFGAPMYPFSDLNWYPANYPPEDLDVSYYPEKYQDKYNWFPGVDVTQVSDIGFHCRNE